MFDIFDFVDSKSVREYSQRLGTIFSPMEQAVLIYKSTKKTVEEKLAAWKKLLNRFSEQQFDCDEMRSRCFVKCSISNRMIVEDTVIAFEAALKLTDKAKGYIFRASILDGTSADFCDCFLFSSYRKAFEHIRRYLGTKGTNNDSSQAVIRAIKLDCTDESNNASFYFDTALRMVDITPQGKYLGLDLYFVYVPLPFKKGDIVRAEMLGETVYGVIAETPCKECFSRACDQSDMNVSVITVCDNDGEICEESILIDFLDLELCPTEELPQEQRRLIELSRRFQNV